jgi:adenylyltransferase/sulfurtransferase
MTGAIKIPREVLAQVYAHAAEGYPEEVCGLLIGPAGAPAVDEARRCANVQNDLHAGDPVANPRTARDAYALGSRDLFMVSKSLRSDRPVRVLYHSHPDVGAYFSETDARVAMMGGDEPAFGGVQYLVVDAQRGGARGAKLFSWDAAARTFVERATFPAP